VFVAWLNTSTTERLIHPDDYFIFKDGIKNVITRE
jgi:hypothetical protein